MQRSTLVLALAVVVLVGAGAFWIASTGNSVRRSGVETPSARADRVPSAPGSLATPRAVSDPSEGAPAKAAATPAAETHREVAPAAARAAGEQIRVRVIDGANGPPVAGASVLARYLTSEPTRIGGKEVRQEDVDRNDVASLDRLVAGERTRTTDVSGLVSVPAPIGGSTIIVASHDGRWGRRVLDEVEHVGDEPETLVLAPDRTLVVRTVDPSGRPVAGIPIQVQYRRWNSWNDARELETDAAGDARFEHIQQDFLSEEAIEAWRVTADVLTLVRPQVELVADALPDEPVVFTIDAGGAVVVEVFGPEGEPWTDTAFVSLGIVEEGQSRRMSVFNQQRRTSVERTLGPNPVRFGHVALGHELDVTVRRASYGSETHAFIAGPRRAGDEVRTSVTMGSDHPIVRMRLVDADGEPFARVDVELQTFNGAATFGSGREEYPRSDGEGVVYVDLDSGWKSGRVQATVSKDDPDAARSAVLQLDRELSNGLTDVGDLVLTSAPILVGGRVVGPGGTPLAGVEVVLFEERTGSWNERHDFDVHTDDVGAFELLGELDDGNLRLEVRDDAFYSKPIPFERGTSDLTITMSPAGRIVGALLVDDHIPLDDFVVQLSASGDGPSTLTWNERRAQLDDEGAFRSAPLPAGTYDVQFNVQWNQTVHEIEGIVVEAGYDARDPRLDGIDLRGALHRFDLTLAGPESEERMNGSVRFGEAGAPELKGSYFIRERDVQIVTKFPTIDVEVALAGFLVKRVRGLTGDAKIELERGFSVRVSLVGDGEVMKAPYGLSLGLVPLTKNASAPEMDWGAPRFDERREIMITGTTTGPARVRWIIEKSVAGAGMATSTDSDPEQIVTLSGADQHVEVALSRDEAARLKQMFED